MKYGGILLLLATGCVTGRQDLEVERQKGETSREWCASHASLARGVQRCDEYSGVAAEHRQQAEANKRQDDSRARDALAAEIAAAHAQIEAHAASVAELSKTNPLGACMVRAEDAYRECLRGLASRGMSAQDIKDVGPMAVQACRNTFDVEERVCGSLHAKAP